MGLVSQRVDLKEALSVQLVRGVMGTRRVYTYRCPRLCAQLRNLPSAIYFPFVVFASLVVVSPAGSANVPIVGIKRVGREGNTVSVTAAGRGTIGFEPQVSLFDWRLEWRSTRRILTNEC